MQASRSTRLNLLPANNFAPLVKFQRNRNGGNQTIRNSKWYNAKYPKPTWDETAPTEARFTEGLNLTVLGLMGSVASENVLGGEALMAPARSSEKDLKWGREGLEATGLAKTIFSASWTSIVRKQVYLQGSLICNTTANLSNRASTLADSFKLVPDCMFGSNWRRRRNKKGHAHPPPPKHINK